MRWFRSRTSSPVLRKPLLYPSELRGHKELRIAGGPLGGPWPREVIADARCLETYHVVRKSRVTLRRLHAGVSEKLLQGRETSVVLNPLTGEGVAHLVNVKPLDPCSVDHSARKRAGRLFRERY